MPENFGAKLYQFHGRSNPDHHMAKQWAEEEHFESLLSHALRPDNGM